MGEPGSEAFRKICCLLHDLGPGGATWQSVRLLAGHVKRGGGATIFAQPGSLAEIAERAGIEVVAVSWGEDGRSDSIWRHVAEHDVAIVQWELGLVDVFARVLNECGRVGLAVHGAPQTANRRLAPPGPMKLRRAVEGAVAEPRAAVVVCGTAHRRKVANAYGVPADAMQIVPTSAPLDELNFRPAGREPREVLAMTRLAPEKMSIVRLAVELARERLTGGDQCRLVVAGDGPRRAEAAELCERRLPRGSWRIEGAPAEPLARLAEAELVVAQGATTLEAAALGRPVVVARSLGAHGASGAVLSPENYDEAARDPFGNPQVTEDAGALWDDVLDLDNASFVSLRCKVEEHNSPAVSLQALDEAVAAAAP